MCRSRCSRPSPSCPRTPCAGGSPASRPPSSCTRRASFPDLEYTFKHALTHEVAYGSLLQERRRALHAPDRRGDRGALRRPAGRARRAAGSPRAPRRAVGSRRRTICARLAGAPWAGRPTARRPAGSSRRWRRSATPREPSNAGAGDRPPARPPQCLVAGRRPQRRSWRGSARPRRWPRRSGTSAAWSRCADRLANALRVGGEYRLAIEVGERRPAIAARLGDDPLSWSVRPTWRLPTRRSANSGGPSRCSAPSSSRPDHPQGAQAVVGATFEPVYARFWLASALGALGEFREACSRPGSGQRSRSGSARPLVMAQVALGLARLSQGDLCRPSPRWSGPWRCAGSGTS